MARNGNERLGKARQAWSGCVRTGVDWFAGVVLLCVVMNGDDGVVVQERNGRVLQFGAMCGYALQELHGIEMFGAFVC